MKIIIMNYYFVRYCNEFFMEKNINMYICKTITTSDSALQGVICEIISDSELFVVWIFL